MNTTILDINGQTINVDLVCYFNKDGKNYLFYTKNETVQDGLIKMYATSECVANPVNLTEDEWTILKKVMQEIIMNTVNGIQYISYVNPVKVNDGKAIALSVANIGIIKNAYTSGTSSTEPLNKDILAQNFGVQQPQIVPTMPSATVEPINVSNSSTMPAANESVPITPINNEAIQMSSIPNVKNDFSLESIPANLNTTPMEPSPEIAVSNIQSINPVVPTVDNITLPEVSPIDNLSTPTTSVTNVSNNDNSLDINSIKPVVDSGFKVSNEPNIFDQPTPIVANVSSPFNITQEEINTPDSAVKLDSPIIPNVQDIVPISTSVVTGSSLDSNSELIELNNKKIKLFEELANIYKEENKILSSNNSESTASNLFNNNGTLNENEVLNS